MAALSEIQAKIVSVLIKRPMTREALLEFVYSGSDGGPLFADECLSVHLNHVRKKLKPLGFSVDNVNHGMRGTALYVLRRLT